MEDTPVEVEVVYQWKPLRCSSCKKFVHVIAQCQPQSMEDLKKIASSEISNPPVAYSKSSFTHLAADSGINQTKQMDSRNDGCHDIDIGSKRNTTDLPLLKATSSGVEDHGQHLLGKVSLALEKNDSSHSASGIEMHFGPCQPAPASDPVTDAIGPRAPILVDRSCPGPQGFCPQGVIDESLAADSSPSPHAAPDDQHGKAPGSAQLASLFTCLIHGILMVNELLVEIVAALLIKAAAGNSETRSWSLADASEQLLLMLVLW
ncbi:hypothetical protein Nepgr_020385 [Nepenthes gracilis]|uniref:Uncharacterized protein n=1 Tax=Nepenthes gracilis TaxID=150966 RepID=A0AAD3SXJ0_NEPGR|nr:hypothetical protein Nepgr_020385 [Nepenthes gracilis]